MLESPQRSYTTSPSCRSVDSADMVREERDTHFNTWLADTRFNLTPPHLLLCVVRR